MPIDKEKERATRKRWNDAHKGYRLKKYGPQKLTKEQRKNKVIREKIGGKFGARMNYNRVLKPKLLALNLDLSCQICGANPAQFHHIKYTINYWYIGYHLCQLHHEEAHKDISILNNVEIKDYNYLIKRPKYIELS